MAWFYVGKVLGPFLEAAVVGDLVGREPGERGLGLGCEGRLGILQEG
jgi:hypothetical protein